jgi:hypothetical protein
MDNFEPIGLSHFFGGMSTDIELGSDAQFYYGKRVDFRKTPSSLTLLPKPTNADGGVVVDLVQGMEQITSGVRYALGDAGYLYKVTTAGVWSTVTNIGEAGGAGILYRSDVDHLYMTGQTKIARISRISSSTPTLQNNWFERGVSTCTTCYKTGGTNTYTIPLTTDETATNKRTFTSDIEPLYQIGVKVLTKGTGTLTLTLHDDANNVLATVTKTTGNVTAGQINYFVFSTPLRIQRGNNGGGSALTYHYHLTSTAADTTIATTTDTSMTDCDMELWANALVTTQNGLHPIAQLSNITLIGNGRYVAQYEPLQDSPTTADFLRHRLTLPPGFEVCGFAQKNLMTVIGAEKRSTSGEFQEGALFFWDGIAETYNDYWMVPEGSPESLFSHKNIVYFIANGSLYRMRGGDEPIKIRTFRNTDSEYSNVADSTHSYPNMMTVRRNILMIGYPSYTTNVNLEHGVYSLGSITNEFPESFGYSYTTSNGNNLNTGSNNLKLGMVKSYGDTMYISWRDDSASPQKYSVDIINNSSLPAESGTLETLSYDNGQPYKYKNAGYAIVTFETLPADTSVTFKWKINGGSWEYSDTVTSGNYLVAPIGSQGGSRFLRIEFGVDLTCAGATSPEVTGIYLFVDTLKNERPLGG